MAVLAACAATAGRDPGQQAVRDSPFSVMPWAHRGRGEGPDPSRERSSSWWRNVVTVSALAGDLRLAYPLVVLGSLELPWLAMRGRFDQAALLADRTRDLAVRGTMPQGHETAATAELWQAM